MIISWFGQACFKFQDRIDGQDITVVTDSFDPEYVGLKLPKNLSANILTVSHQHQDHNFVSGVSGQPFLIDSAGEYEIAGLAIDGIDSYHDQKQDQERGSNLIFRFEFSDLTVAHLGDLGEPLESGQLDRLPSIDVLLVPVGGHYTIDTKGAIDVINQIEPRVIVPMHYSLPGLKFELDSVDSFIKAIGLPVIYETKLKITRRDISQEGTKLIVLSPAI